MLDASGASGLGHADGSAGGLGSGGTTGAGGSGGSGAAGASGGNGSGGSASGGNTGTGGTGGTAGSGPRDGNGPSAPADGSAPTRDAGIDSSVMTGACHTVACAGTCSGTPLGCSGAWTCDTQPRPCTSDLAQFCGCDGRTFTGSGSCPTRAFAYRGPCMMGASCDPREVLCRLAPPTCPAGQVPSVAGTCWGPCVPVDECRCAVAAACPEPTKYTCQVGRGRCAPLGN